MARRLALIALSLVAVAAAVALVVRFVDERAGDERVTRAPVPGVGMVEGAVRPGTAVRPPARVRAAEPLGPEGVRLDSAAQSRAFEQAAPGGDSGLVAEREAVMQSLQTKVFLTLAATACLRPPPAALAVFDFVFVAPQLRPELENLVTTRRVMRGRQSCSATRLRVDEWRGVRVRGTKATALLRGARERRVGDDWEARRYEWRAILRRTDGDWKIAAMTGDDLDYDD